MSKSISKLAVSILICQCAGLIGTIFTVSSITNWYNFLNQPSFKPPNSLFGPVWTILYTLIGISLYWIWIKPQSKKRTEALGLFAVHLIINSLWSIIFFGLHQIFAAFVVIVVLWVTLIIVMKRFLAIDSRASWILFPYLIWLSFATLLNLAIWWLNR